VAKAPACIGDILSPLWRVATASPS
jgi:hypothetical protein